MIKGYLSGGLIPDLDYFLEVSKGVEGICMVIDNTMSGMNEEVWGTNVLLPVVGITLIMVDLDTHMVDLDMEVNIIELQTLPCIS